MILFRHRKQTVPVLTYHSINVHQNTYKGNDHIAFEADLNTIDRLGLRIIPLDTVVDWHKGLVSDSEVDAGVALTLDDGSWLDYHNIIHPSCGVQIGMYKLLEKFKEGIPEARQPFLHVSSLVCIFPIFFPSQQ